jgi:lysophospholipase L1-like esterase
VPHLALVGDGILANGAHTKGQPDSAAALRQLLPAWTVSLVAGEGSMIADVASQLPKLNGAVDIAVLSVGGNDAMRHVDLLQQPAASSGETLDALIAMADGFAGMYERVVKSVRERAPRLIVCTIYEPPLVGKNTANRARVLLTMLNDGVLKAAYRWGLDVLDLRAICRAPEDFTLQVSPSGAGAAKIAHAIAAVLEGTEAKRTTVIAG